MLSYDHSERSFSGRSPAKVMRSCSRHRLSGARAGDQCRRHQGWRLQSRLLLPVSIRPRAQLTGPLSSESIPWKPIGGGTPVRTAQMLSRLVTYFIFLKHSSLSGILHLSITCRGHDIPRGWLLHPACPAWGIIYSRHSIHQPGVNAVSTQPRLRSPSSLHPKPFQHRGTLIWKQDMKFHTTPEFEAMRLPGVLFLIELPHSLFKLQCKCHFLCEVIPNSKRKN